jgi:hypothetical protein
MLTNLAKSGGYCLSTKKKCASRRKTSQACRSPSTRFAPACPFDRLRALSPSTMLWTLSLPNGLVETAHGGPKRTAGALERRSITPIRCWERGRDWELLTRSSRSARPRFAPDSGAGRLPGDAVFIAAVPRFPARKQAIRLFIFSARRRKHGQISNDFKKRCRKINPGV